MLEGFVQAIANFGRLEVVLGLFFGVLVGVIVGVIPVIGALLSTALILPFVFGMDPLIILPFLCALSAVTCTGGSVTTILLGIPGTGSNLATLLDGYPMTKKGEAARGIGAALTASMFGGIISAPLALIMIPWVTYLVLKCRSPEMFLIIVIGLTFLAVLARGSMIKGLISGGLGLLLAFIGFQYLTGINRFTFGSVYLLDGLSLIAVILGVFVVPVLVELSVSGKPIAPAETEFAHGVQELLKGARDVLHHWGLWLRCSLIGYIVGVIPGIGQDTAIFVAYAHAKQRSKHSDKFGKGEVEGVIAPESANNAVNAGALLTTLAFGIPGSALMVIMLAAFVLVGIVPGPRMLIEHTALSFTMLLSIPIANLLAGLMFFFGAPYLIKVTRVNPVLLFSIILPLVCLGAFVGKEAMVDLFVVLILGVLGVCFEKFGYSRPALVLGFVLGGLLEYYFFHALKLFGPMFFLSSPISLVLFFGIIALVSAHSMRPVFQRSALRFRARIKREVMTTRSGSYFLMVLLAVTLGYIALALALPTLEAKLLPLAISGFVAVLAAIELRNELLTRREAKIATKPEAKEAKKVEVRTRGELRRYVLALVWISGFILAVYLLGFRVSIPLFVFCYQRLNGQGWLVCIGTAAVMAILAHVLFVLVLGADLYPGLLFELLFQ